MDAPGFPSSPRNCCRWPACRCSSVPTDTTTGTPTSSGRRSNAGSTRRRLKQRKPRDGRGSSSSPRKRRARTSMPFACSPCSSPTGTTSPKTSGSSASTMSPTQPNQPCATPLLMIQDLGATFGPIKVNIAAWSEMPVWADRHSCTVSMKQLPYQGATFPDARISEAGRAQLAQALSALSRDQIESLFRNARFPEFQSATDDERDLEAWVSAFAAPGGSDRHGWTVPATSYHYRHQYLLHLVHHPVHRLPSSDPAARRSSCRRRRP